MTSPLAAAEALTGRIAWTTLRSVGPIVGRRLFGPSFTLARRRIDRSGLVVHLMTLRALWVWDRGCEGQPQSARDFFDDLRLAAGKVFYEAWRSIPADRRPLFSFIEAAVPVAAWPEEPAAQEALITDFARIADAKLRDIHRHMTRPDIKRKIAA